MSLATLKVKVQKLIDKASIYNAIFKNEPVNLVIPNGVTIVSENIYAPLTIESVKGTDVEEITENFFSMSNIKSVDLPKLKIIGDISFNECLFLEELNVPTVTTIGSNPFYSTNNLKKVVLGTLTTVNEKAFRQTSRGTGGSIEYLEVGNGTSADLYLQYSTKYSQAVLHKIIENLANKTGQTAGVFYVGADNLEKIDGEHIAILESKNWVYQ